MEDLFISVLIGIPAVLLLLLGADLYVLQRLRLIAREDGKASKWPRRILAMVVIVGLLVLLIKLTTLAIP
ncbi:MAG: hypothetical protein HKN82_15150 [Akkermansiaceae bacterium]|nr:hypothetical protein [Akkermansiaceae bacterium]